MKKDILHSISLASFREAMMELDNTYSLFPKSCGLSDAEYWSLLFIYEGVVTQSQISNQLSLSRQTLNSAFKQLRKKGLIRLEPYEKNQRSKQAFLTAAGRSIVEKHVVQMHQIEEKAWTMLKKDERAALITLTQKYTKCIWDLLKPHADNSTIE